MESKTKKQKKSAQSLPKWFEGVQYSEGAEVTNPFSKESYYLNETELSMYDFIIGCQMVFDQRILNDEMIKDFQKGLTWFRLNSPEAYYVLLD
tara:strand:- start:125 stop:403 length:279 start_codon:yes stop_codon:yes gene_type:complete